VPVTSVSRRLLQRTDWFTQEKACKLLTAVLGARPSKEIQLANGAGPSTSSAAAAVSTAPPIVAAASESVQVRPREAHDLTTYARLQVALHDNVRTLSGSGFAHGGCLPMASEQSIGLWQLETC